MRYFWIAFAVVVTISWISAFVYLAFYVGIGNGNISTNSWHFPKLDLNEWGDLLAGAFSPLAFFWFVFAVFLQISEIRQNRIETQLSREAAQQQSITTSKLLETENRNQEIKISELITDFQNKHANIVIGLAHTKTKHSALFNSRRHLWAAAGQLNSEKMKKFESDWHSFDNVLKSADEQLAKIQVDKVKYLEELNAANEQVNRIRAQTEVVKAAIELWREADNELREIQRDQRI